MNDLLLLTDQRRRHKDAKFEPDPEMILWAEMYIESRRNIAVACAAIGDPNRNKYYSRPHGWRWNEEFMLWLNKYCKEWVLKHCGDWYLIALKHAERGSFQHLELLMEIAREFIKPNGITIQSEGDVHVKTPHAVIFSSIVQRDKESNECHNRI